MSRGERAGGTTCWVRVPWPLPCTCTPHPERLSSKREASSLAFRGNQRQSRSRNRRSQEPIPWAQTRFLSCYSEANSTTELRTFVFIHHWQLAQGVGAGKREWGTPSGVPNLGDPSRQGSASYVCSTTDSRDTLWVSEGHCSAVKRALGPRLAQSLSNHRQGAGRATVAPSMPCARAGADSKGPACLGTCQ